ncbi:thioredoxin family protein [Salinarimonas rosea]|uniref:thioredoxin family protein n=1 Tax=Salinarimonas rosea TaxID=552063 RepID=UPI001FD9C485|nr:thioredoxin family protein [Salinarimonas rosea]
MGGIGRRRFLRSIAALAGAAALARALGPLRVAAAEAGERGVTVTMFRRAGCPWCHAWDREIGGIWPKSDVGARHAMRMVDLDTDPMPEIALDRPVRFTPTFVVARDGAEIGRIEGYPGQDFFWGLIERLVAEAEADDAGSGASTN